MWFSDSESEGEVNVLPVEDLNRDFNEEELSLPPSTPQEYLQRVRWEAKKVPKVILSNIDPRKYDQNQTKSWFPITNKCTPAPPGLKFSVEWEEEFLKDFTNIQKITEDTYNRLSKALPKKRKGEGGVPPINDAPRWAAYCFGKSKRSRSDLDTKCKLNEESEGTPPSWSIMYQLDSVAISTILTYHIKWLESDELSESRAEWLFALLARLSKPLDADVAANLRSLLRRLCDLRASINDLQDVRLPPLNVLIVIVGKYFGQKDPDEDI